MSAQGWLATTTHAIIGADVADDLLALFILDLGLHHEIFVVLHLCVSAHLHRIFLVHMHTIAYFELESTAFLINFTSN